jgi:hypothetical protein
MFSSIDLILDIIGDLFLDTLFQALLDVLLDTLLDVFLDGGLSKVTTDRQLRPGRRGEGQATQQSESNRPGAGFRFFCQLHGGDFKHGQALSGCRL